MHIPEAVGLLQSDMAELLQLGVLTVQVSWKLFEAVSTDLHAVHVLLVMRVDLVA